ncbi:MAG: zinc ABC transporter substrate-binding protein [Flavobacteriia bacterium]|nr:zinc ABC transporter substrate-binding protein [Flavobacteriia bacterium]
MKSGLLILAIGILMFACKWDAQKYNSPKMIVCTTTIVGDIVKNIVGNRYEIKTLMGAGVDPHIYEAKPSDVRAMGEANVIILSGLHLEGKMSDLFLRLKDEKNIISFSDGMNVTKLIRLNAHSFDPHVWFDVDLWGKGMLHCKNSLQKIYPKDAVFFEKNYQKMKLKFQLLKQEITKKINTIPRSKRVLVTSHDAFHYFGKAYGIDVKALQGVSTVTEPGLRNVSNLVDFLVEKKIPAVFIESSVSSKSIKAVLEACLKRGHQLKIGGTLYSDALGGSGSNANTYLKMIRQNVQTFTNSMN